MTNEDFMNKRKHKKFQSEVDNLCESVANLPIWQVHSGVSEEELPRLLSEINGIIESGCEEILGGEK